MLAIGLELLVGRYIATAYNDRDRAEWPPHPARLFSALVATWAETSPHDEQGGKALAWLAEQAPPRILASARGDVSPRAVTTVFVPVNDVSLVSSPSREKLDAALDVLASAQDDKARAKAGKEVTKLETKLAEATARAVAAPEKFNKSDASSGSAILPEGRTRQPRTFPCVTPEIPRVGFVWPDASPSEGILEMLGTLLTRLVRVGHSSSFVAARILREDEVASLEAELTTYREDPEAGEHVIRWVGPRQVRALEEAFAIHQETEPRVLPSVFVTYSEGEPRVEAKPPASLFDPGFIVLAHETGPRLPITAVPDLSRQLRRALMSALGTDIPEVLSGHRPDGAPSERPHVAIVPLPFVGGPHADGAILGVALVLPRELDAASRKRVLAALAKLGVRAEPSEPLAIHLHLGVAGTLELRPTEWGDDGRATLRASRWTQPSRAWATVTPIALDRNPGDLHATSQSKRAAAFAEAEACVATAIERIGLPRPRIIEVLRSCVLSGTAKPRSYRPFPADPSKPKRVLVHASVEFEHKVRGPLLVGAGRYQGMGLFLPLFRDHEGLR